MKIISKIKLIIVLLILAIFIPGCVSTRLTSFADPKYEKIEFKSICINFEEQGLVKKKDAEMIFSFVLRKGLPTLQTLTATNIFLPTREYTKNEIYSTLKEKGCDGYLVVELKGESHEITSGTPYVNSKGHIFGGGSESTQTRSYNIFLYDVNTGDCVWTAGSEMKGSDTWTDFDNFVSAMAKKVRQTLIMQRYISNKA